MLDGTPRRSLNSNWRNMNRYHFKVPLHAHHLYLDMVAETPDEAVRIVREQLTEQLSNGCALRIPLHFIGNATLYMAPSLISEQSIFHQAEVEETPQLAKPVSSETSPVQEELRA